MNDAFSWSQKSHLDFVSYNVRHGHKDQDQYVVHPQLNENSYKFALVVLVESERHPCIQVFVPVIPRIVEATG